MKAKELELYFISPVRRGKKLLVLDLDYTLFDIKGTASDFHRTCTLVVFCVDVVIPQSFVGHSYMNSW